ncbi:CPBP family intramembrane glutamic endopeptidase [Clostridium estertheticum]|uniref:CPBP family intramembrane glutamic endopeptidase n=1 Tax=Clostridium estertheticum TaxID=238834 RepID=UPI001C7D8952|nr:type II CAAX endopeptidase family protein [Clostridium estertheticum]MBX4267824.1 CPBP family intramembrane metalloprotease [Clostridium estertheticum]WLC78063.1 CPBP family intramembrane metalloprotease [Clostridium estertheticum]
MKIMMLLISAILQAILFLIIPFVWWLICGRKEVGFLKWVGLKKPIIKNKIRYVITFVFTIVVMSILSFVVLPFIDKATIATSQFSGHGMSALIPCLIYAFLQTGFSEELLFRGFMTKRLIHKFGFQVGNLLQSLLFGLIHGLMFISTVGLLGTIIIILFTGLLGWLMGWINEKQSDGSIVSSWLIHGCANTIASIIAMFNIL